MARRTTRCHFSALKYKMASLDVYPTGCHHHQQCFPALILNISLKNHNDYCRQNKFPDCLADYEPAIYISSPTLSPCPSYNHQQETINISNSFDLNYKENMTDPYLYPSLEVI